MSQEQVTIAVIVATIVSLIAYDVYAVLRGGKEATISGVIAQFSHKFPIIAFAGGLLCGHFWWPV